VQQRRQAVADAYLAVEAARKVFESCLLALDAKLINGPPSEIQKYRDGSMAACEALLDRKAELIWAQQSLDGFDPTTRKLT
jgi:hypothetical protein